MCLVWSPYYYVAQQQRLRLLHALAAARIRWSCDLVLCESAMRTQAVR